MRIHFLTAVALPAGTTRQAGGWGSRDFRDMNFTEQFLAEVRAVLDEVDSDVIEKMAHALAAVRSRGGRLFALGIGGNAANASHLVNDLRKIVGMEAYAPTDNVAELTARTNDEGWASVFEAWLRTSRLAPTDAVLALSVGGGSLEQNISPKIRSMRFPSPVKRAPLSLGSWGAMADTPPRSPMCVSLYRPATRLTSRHTPKLSNLSCGTCWCLTPR